VDEDGGDEGKCGAQENIAANFFLIVAAQKNSAYVRCDCFFLAHKDQRHPYVLGPR